MEAKELILRLIQDCPNILRTNLVKMCFLYDLACVQKFGEPDTDLPYGWDHYGPYCSDIIDATRELANGGKVNIEQSVTMRDREIVTHRALTKEKTSFGFEREQLLEYIARKFGKMSYQSLIDFVYSTPPMAEAKSKDRKYQKLNLETLHNVPAYMYDPEFVDIVLRSEQDLKEGRILAKDKLFNTLGL